MDDLVWRMVFNTVDTNHDGKVDRAELAAALRKLGGAWTPDRVDEALDSYDADASGDLSYDQFLPLVKGDSPTVDPAMVRAFRSMDLDNDGKLSEGELTELFSAAGVDASEAIREFIEEGDTDGDGLISFPEFVAMTQQ